MPSMVSSMGSTWIRLPYFTSAHCTKVTQDHHTEHLIMQWHSRYKNSDEGT